MLNPKSNHLLLSKVITLFFMSLALLLSGCSSQPVPSPDSKPKPSVKIAFTQADKAKIRRYSIALKSAQLGQAFSKRFKGEYHYKVNDRLPLFYPRLPLSPLLDRKLSPLPPGYTRIQIGDDFGIININSRVIYDLIYNVE